MCLLLYECFAHLSIVDMVWIILRGQYDEQLPLVSLAMHFKKDNINTYFAGLRRDSKPS